MKMTRGRGRPRGGKAAAQGRQNYPYTPPLQNRYSTRSSKGNIAAPQLLALPPSGSRRCLRPALRILKEGGQGASKPIGDDPVFENSVEDEKPSTANGSPSSNHDMDLDGLCARIAAQVEGTQEAAPQQKSLQDADEDLQPPRENPSVLRSEPVVEKLTTTDAPPTNQSLSHCHSVNMTEFAKGLKDETNDHDPDEVVSTPRRGYEFVHGHEVKTEISGLVRAIFGRYGDITRECKVKSPSIFSFLLERMCDVYHTLRSKNLYDLTLVDINIMRDELLLCEDHKLDVAWLVERLNQISELTNCSEEYLMLKKEIEECMVSKRKIDKKLEQYRRHVGLIQKEITTLEQDSAQKEAKASQYTQRAIEIRTRAKALGSQSLVHGLL